MDSVKFKYRTKTWRLKKDSNCFSLFWLNGGGNWEHRGYYTDPEAIILTLIKENFIKDEDGKNFIAELRKTCKELSEVIKNTLGSYNK